MKNKRKVRNEGTLFAVNKEGVIYATVFNHDGSTYYSNHTGILRDVNMTEFDRLNKVLGLQLMTLAEYSETFGVTDPANSTLE